MKRLLILTLAFALLAAACGTSSEDTTTTAPPGTTSSPTTTATPTTTAPTTTAGPTTAPPTTTQAPTTTAAPTTTTLPGEPIDIGPADGDIVAVIGVEFDDVLNLRAAPGTNQVILEELAPTFDEMIAQGEAWLLPNSIWYKVEAEGTVGWVSSRFVAYLGSVADDTSRIIAALGEIPTAETMLGLADIVAGVLGSSEEPISDVTVTVAPTVGDLGEVTIDIVGLGDDSVRGFRAHIFGQPTDSGDGFSLKSVETTTLCGRGVSDGLCT